MRIILRKTVSVILSFVMILSLFFSEGMISKAAVADDVNARSSDVFTQKELADMGYVIPGSNEAKIDKDEIAKNARSISQGIQNEYVEVNVNSDGRYTIGTVEGNPNYGSDNNKKLLFGHPGGSTSDTLIKIDDNEFFFYADSIHIDEENRKVYAYMTMDEYDVQITETLEFVKSDDGVKNIVKIGYKATNMGESVHQIGIRIMMDTMLASNDSAPFKVSGYGNVTTRKEFSGDEIPTTYQVYDNLDNPTTIGTGIVYKQGEEKPDRVQFTNWGNVSGSAWNYDHGEGSELGDSAVVFYFNPENLDAGSSRSVSTYYGCSVSSALGGDAEISIGGKQIGVRVKNSSNGEGLKQADVKITNLSTGRSIETKTDDIGLALFDNVSTLKGNCKIRITKSGYQSKEIEKNLKSGQLVSIVLRKNEYASPEITSVKLDGKDILFGDNTVIYCENKDEVNPTASNSKTILLKVSANQSGCTYRLIQNGSVVDTSRDGTFRLTLITKNKKGENYNIPRLNDFIAGSKIYVQAVSSKGNVSDKERLGIQMKEPSSGTLKSSKASLSIGDKITIKTNGDDMNPVERFFLGDADISLGSDIFPADVEIDETGKVKIAINKSNNESIEDFEKHFTENMNTMEKRKKMLQSLGGKNIRVGGVKPLEWSIAGYGEGVIQDGVATVDVNVYAYLKKGVSWQTYWIVLSCPVYVKTSIDGKLQGEIGVKAEYNDGWIFSFTKGDINPNVRGAVEVGAGISGVLSIGIEGAGDLDFLYSLPNSYYKLSTTLSCGIKAKAFLLEYNKTWAEYTKVWADGYSGGKRARSAMNQEKAETFDMSEFYDFDNFHQIPRTYLNVKNTKTRSEMALWNTDVNAITVKSNVFTNAQPQYVEVDGHRYCFFLDDANGIDGVSDRTAVNRTVLVYSEWNEDNGMWSAPMAVNDDGTADFSFDVASQNGKVYVVWQNTNKIFDTEDVSVEQYSKYSDIAAAVLDSNSDTISQYQVTSTEHADMMPRISAKGTQVSIVWYENVSNDITGSDISESIIHGAQLVDDAYRETLHQIIEEGMINGLDVGYIGNDMIISMALDENHDATDLEDMEIYYMKNNTLSKLTDNTSVDSRPMFVQEGENDVLYWYQDGSVAYSADFTSVESITQKEGMPFADDFAILSNETGTEKKIIWSGYSTIDNEDLRNKSIFTVDYQNGTWSEPYELNGLGEGIISSLSGYLDEDGKEHIVLQKVEYQENFSGTESSEGEENISEVTASNVYYITSKDRACVSVDSIDYDMNAAAVGENLPISMSVTNIGNIKMDSLTIKIGEYTKDIAVDLNPGESKEILLEDYVVPSIENGTTETLEIIKADNQKIQDVIYDAEQEIYLGYTDLKVEEAGREIIDAQEYCLLHVENISKTDADQVNLKVIADEEDGQVIVDQFIDQLKAGESTIIYVPMDKFESIEIAYLRLTSNTEEKNVLNNKGILALSNEIYDIAKEITFSVSAQDSTMGQASFTRQNQNSETKTFLGGDVVELKAVPKEGYVFTGWTEQSDMEISGTFGNRNADNTTYILPNQNVKVIANFAVKNHAKTIKDDKVDYQVFVDDRFTLNPVLETDNGQSSTDYVKWTSSNEKIASVNEGEVLITGTGSASITAELIRRTSSGEQSTGQKVIYQIAARERQIENLVLPSEPVALDGKGISVALGDELTVIPFNGKGNIVWESSDNNVATVDEKGNVTAIGKGTATITASVEEDKNIKATCEVLVTVPITGIRLNKTELTLEKGDTFVLTANPIPADHSEQNVGYRWQSLDERVAVVEADGNQATVRAVEDGTAAIVVSVDDEVSSYCNISVETRVKSIKDASVMIEDQIYTGQALTPPVQVMLDDKKLTAGVDYTVTYKNNINVGTAIAIITGIGNYTDFLEKTFIIKSMETGSTDMIGGETGQTGSTDATGTLPQDNTPQIQDEVPSVGTILRDKSEKYLVKKSGTKVEDVELEYLGTTDSNEDFIFINSNAFIDFKMYRVTSIADKAFKNNKKITAVIIQGNISIGKSAFQGCKSLKTVTLGANVSKIGKKAFYNCKNMHTLKIKAKNLTEKSIGKKAFFKAGSTNYRKFKVTVTSSTKKCAVYTKILRKKGLSPKVKVKKQQIN